MNKFYKYFFCVAFSLVLLLLVLPRCSFEKVAFDDTKLSESETTPSTDFPNSVPNADVQEIVDPLLFSNIYYIAPADILEATYSADDVMIAISLIWEALECPLYTENARIDMEAELARLNDIYDQYQYDIKYFCLLEEKLGEYYYATSVWLYLKDLGYSDVACAGIIGNMMAECGGHTLSLQPTVYSPDGAYYGICQWSQKYYPETADMSFEDQLDFLQETIIKTFKTYGKLYAPGFTFEDFNNLESPRDAALAFAKIYERCASWTYERRQNFSEVAYNYFVTDFEFLK